MQHIILMSPGPLISPLSNPLVHSQLPNGVMNGEQLRYAAEAITPYGADGCADITTRAGIQLRGITLEDAGPICEKLIAKNMSSFQTGMDSIRNLTGSPIAGQWGLGLQRMQPIACPVLMQQLNTCDQQMRY